MNDQKGTHGVLGLIGLFHHHEGSHTKSGGSARNSPRTCRSWATAFERPRCKRSTRRPGAQRRRWARRKNRPAEATPKTCGARFVLVDPRLQKENTKVEHGRGSNFNGIPFSWWKAPRGRRKPPGCTQVCTWLGGKALLWWMLFALNWYSSVFAMWLWVKTPYPQINH